MRGVAVVACLVVLATAGSGAVRADTEDDYRRARELAHDGRRDEARQICISILERRPDHHDTRILLGRLYAWDKDYESARRELVRVVEAKPGYADARSALIDVEMWSGHPEEALRLADDGIALDPESAELHLARARALNRLRRYDEAAEAAERTLELDPGNDQVNFVLRRIYDEILTERVSVEYEYENFDDIDAWHELIVQYRRAFGFGSIDARLNLADRFDDTGAQLEVDAYPRLRPGTYMYLNAGVSGSDLYPDFRAAAEVYQALPGAWETSGGFRYLDFDTSDVWIVTGTVAKYHGDWWIQFRPSWVHDDDGNSLSGEIQARRYLAGRYEYWGVTVGGGFEDQQDIITREEDRLDRVRVKLDLRKRITNRLLLRTGVGYREQDFASDVTRESWFVKIGIERFF